MLIFDIRNNNQQYLYLDRIFKFLIRLTGFFVVLPAFAQGDLTAEQKLELQKKLQNPVANVQSFPFQNNFDFGYGPQRNIKYTLNFQPGLPKQLSNGAMLVIRPIVPVIIASPEPVKAVGLGDVNLGISLVPKSKKPGFMLGGGMQLSVPTATDALVGTGKWAAGPNLILVNMSKKIVAGMLLSNIWSFAGDQNRSEVNFLLCQIFFNYNLRKGLSISYSPNITANWNAAGNDVWTLPLGAGLTKMLPLKGGKAVTLIGQYYYNVVRPDFGPVQTLRFQINYAIPRD